jgi:predicted transcriptional regulator
MAERPDISLDEIAEEIDKTRKTAQRIVKDLKDSGHAKRVGSRKTGHLEVTNFAGSKDLHNP